jgi:hypothetical protein
MLLAPAPLRTFGTELEHPRARQPPRFELPGELRHDVPTLRSGSRGDGIGERRFDVRTVAERNRRSRTYLSSKRVKPG